MSVARKQADAIKKSRRNDMSVEEEKNNSCLLRMINEGDKTLFKKQNNLSSNELFHAHPTLLPY
jgi:hypothetical protein